MPHFTVVTDTTPAVPVPLDLMNAMRTWLKWLRQSMVEARDERPETVNELGPVVDSIAELDRIDAMWLTIVQTAALIYFRRIAPLPAAALPNTEDSIPSPINEKGC